MLSSVTHVLYRPPISLTSTLFLRNVFEIYIQIKNTIKLKTQPHNHNYMSIIAFILRLNVYPFEEVPDFRCKKYNSKRKITYNFSTQRKHF